MSKPGTYDESALSRLISELCEVCRLFGERQWCLATSGNFSARIDADRFLITQSGRDKSALTLDDLMICDMDGKPQIAHLRPSAETALHQCLYAHDENIGAVLHTHSVTATALSRRAAASLSISGYEMQKAFAGITSHETEISVPVYENTQDMPALAREVRAELQSNPPKVPAFLIRGHGLYAWGRNLAEAKRHTEGMEFLMACLLQDLAAGRP
ncbi:MAG: methylthioribulose 1-phosphate dehydratase [Woeseiaceae bacterium]